MDVETGIFQERPAKPNFHGFRHLTLLDRSNGFQDGDFLQQLWAKVQTQEYAFDDFAKNRVDWFLYQLADLNSEFLLIGDHGMFMINHPIAKGSADIHFVVWDKEYSLYKEREVVHELFDWLFFEKKIHRAQAMVPNYNNLAQRFTLACGFRYEGELQQAVLWKGKYWNVKMYGLLEHQYRERKERTQVQ